MGEVGHAGALPWGVAGGLPMIAPFTAHALLLWTTSVLAFFMAGGKLGGSMLAGGGGGAVLFAFLLAVGSTGWVSAQALEGTCWATGLAFLGGLEAWEAAGEAVLGVG